MALLQDLYAFYLEHRRRGDLDADVEGERFWMACECGAVVSQAVAFSPEAGCCGPRRA